MKTNIFLQVRQAAFRFDRVMIALIFITALGAFLRAYEFHDWLRFNSDQARDATIVYEMSSGNIPLLGPLAGGTNFHLGPIIYYFQYVSGFVFGFDPDKLAYPDLFFSILTIPLLFFFVRRSFGWKITLLMAFLCAVSGFMIRYGRFAWNPNSMPFFTMLFLFAGQSFFGMEKGRQIFWAVLFGIGLGVGIQLHAFLFILLPLLTVILFSFLFFQKRLLKTSVALSIGIALFLNIPQVFSEMKSGGANIQAFFESTTIETTKTENTSGFSEKIEKNVLCHIRDFSFIVSATGDSEDCARFVKSKKEIFKNPLAAIHVFSEIFFVVGGICLLGYVLWRESEIKKKFYLGCVVAYIVLLFFLLFPVADELSMRYFLANAFVPFFLLAVWADIFFRRGIFLKFLFILFFAGLIVSNIIFLQREFRDFREGKVSDSSMSILGEMEPLTDFVSRNILSNGKAILDGDSSYVRRFHGVFAYKLLLEKKELSRRDKDMPIPESGTLFFIHKKTRQYDALSSIDGYPILDRKTSGRVTVFLLRK